MPVPVVQPLRLIVAAAAAAALLALVALAVVPRAHAAQAATPACFGAADRDPQKPCDNPALNFSGPPTPADALLAPNSPCDITERTGVLVVCRFGVQADRAAGRPVALVGDSHA